MDEEMYWEGRIWKLKLHGAFTPIDICQQLGRSGRNALLEVLLVNYRDEVDELRARIHNYETSLRENH